MPLAAGSQGAAAITRNNEYLLWLNGDGLHRCRMYGDHLRYEESGPRLSARADVLEASLDSKYVVCRGDRDILDKTAPEPEGWCVFDVARLGGPVATVWYNRACPPVSVDPVTGKTYVFGPKGFGVIGRTGQVERVLPPAITSAWTEADGNRPLNPTRLLAHPKGNAAILLGESVGYFIEVPATANRTPAELSAAREWDAPAKTGGPPTPPAPRPEGAVRLPPENVEPETVNAAIKQWEQAEGGFRITCFGRPKETLSHALWSRDGRRLYAVESASWLLEIDVDGWVVRRRARLSPPPARVTQLGWSKEGIVVTQSSRQGLQLTIVEPDTMRADLVVTANVSLLATSPASSLGFVLPSGADVYAVVRLRDVKLQWKASMDQLLGPSLAQDDAAKRAVTAAVVGGDGKYIFCMNGLGLHRARIESDRCVFEQRVNCEGGQMDLSLDGSRIVRHTFDPGRDRNVDRPVVSYVCDVHNLAAPLGSLQFSGKSLPASVDPVTKRVYVVDTKGVAVVDAASRAAQPWPPAFGNKLAENAEGRRLKVTRLLPHPKGNAVLLLCNGAGCFIEVPKAEGAP